MIYLLIEYIDELVFGVGEIAWPLIRDDLQLTYTQIGLFTDFAFIHFIDRQPDSVKFLRFTAALQLIFFPLFLLIPGFIPKMIMIVFVNFCNTGWYPILQGRLYSNLPGQSASVMAIGSVAAPLAKFFPFLLGLLADRFGLHNAMWILLLAPIALIIGLPRNK